MKVLQISMGEELGGIEKLMWDVTSRIKNISFSFLTPVEVFKNKKNAYSLGVSRKKFIGKIKYNFRLYKYLRKNKYDVVHINSGVFLYLFQVVVIAKLAGVKKIIVHSHSVPKISKFKKFLSRLLVLIYKKKVDCFIACSLDAVKSLMIDNRKVIILKNGIDISKFRFSEKVRKEKRLELKIADDITIYGNIGRLDDNKNQEFLIDIFDNICKKNEKSLLLLVGDGPNIGKLQEKVIRLGLKDKVLFLGYREDVSSLLMAMDVFIMTSKSEGLGIVVIEALTVGLVSFISTGLPEEVMICNNCIRINSSDSEEWSKIILSYNINREKDNYKYVIKNDYDINIMAKRLTNIYKDLIK